MSINRRMMVARSPFPDPEGMLLRRGLEFVKMQGAKPEPTFDLYVGLDRICKCCETGKEFKADDLGIVHIPRELEKTTFLVPDELADECAALEDHVPLAPPRESGVSWTEFLRRRNG